MTDEQWTRVRDVLYRALDRPSGERVAWIEATCEDEPEVRREVLSLLDAYEAEDPFFEGGFASPEGRGQEQNAAGDETAVERPGPGARIGVYRLVEEVGVGGMSVVYRAERADGEFEQTVAIKLLQRRLHADEAEQRVRAERQVLASLDHPHIARLIDGGVTEGGRPYLVMEYVDGVPLVEYVEARDLGLEARLDLLEQVFEAVQAAHRRLVVHRDLKSSNVFVAETNDGPQIKLLDFGIAKLLDDSMPGPRPTTRTGHRLLTPAYAAPEQLTGAEVDTRTDVYQLGVLAYELLTGTRPFKLEGRSPTERERIVVEEPPSAPSTVAEAGGVDPSRLRGDLDTIIQKALRKESERRYRSVEALAADLQRWGRGEPIEARTATLGYRTKKFVMRHRWGVSVGAGVLLLIAVGATLLVQQRNRARREAQTAEQVSQYLTSLFEEADPHLVRGDTVTARELLRQGMNRIDELEGQPLVQAELMYVLGRTRWRIGLYDSTRALFEQALEIRRQHLGHEHPEVAQVLSTLALLVRDAEGDYAKAESLLTEAKDIYREVHGLRHETVAARLKELVYVQRQQGKLEEAKESVRQALSIQRAIHGDEHMSVAESLYNLAAILRDQDRHGEAEKIQRRSLALCRKLTDGPHPGTAANLHNLGYVLSEQGKYREAEALYRRALSMKRELFDAPHPEIAASLENLSQVLHHQNKYDEAEKYLRKTLRMRRALYEEEHPLLAGSLVNLGDLLQDRRRLAAADSAFRAARAMLRRLGKEESPKMAEALRQHGALLENRGAYVQAETAYRKALSVERRVHGPDHSDVRKLESTLASLSGK